MTEMLNKDGLRTIKQAGHEIVQTSAEILNPVDLIAVQPEAVNYLDGKKRGNTPAGKPGEAADSIPASNQSPIEMCGKINRDSRYEPDITRDEYGRVLHTSERYPRFSYDENGNLSKIRYGNGSFIYKETTYQLINGAWVNEDGRPVEMTFSVDQTTGELTVKHPTVTNHRQSDGSSYDTDLNGKVLHIDDGKASRSFTYDADGRLSKVHFRQRGSRDYFEDDWVRQPDGMWVNMKEGQPTGRVLKDIRVHPDGTYEETDHLCQTRVFRMERRRN